MVIFIVLGAIAYYTGAVIIGTWLMSEVHFLLGMGVTLLLCGLRASFVEIISALRKQ